MQIDHFTNYPARTVRKGEIILHAGQRPSHLFYLKKGFARRYVDSIEGRELTIHIFEKGSTFPLSWALNNENPNFNLAALTDCEIALIPKEDFLKFIKNYDELAAITRKLLYGLEGMAKRLENMSFEKADMRVMSTINYLAKHFGNLLPFTHEDLSSLTSLSRERVSIEMKKLKNRGIVSYKRNVIKVLPASAATAAKPPARASA